MSQVLTEDRKDDLIDWMNAKVAATRGFEEIVTEAALCVRTSASYHRARASVKRKTRLGTLLQAQRIV